MQNSNTRILWYCPGTGYSEKMKVSLGKYFKAARINDGNIFFVSVHTKVKNIWTLRGKGKFVVELDKQEEILREIRMQIKVLKPKVIVCNDRAVLAAVTRGNHSLYLCRGSVYFIDEVPVIPVDEMVNLHTQKDAIWIFLSDLGKIWRWQHGKQRVQPKFEYTVCQNLGDIARAEEYLSNCLAQAEDIETKAGFITCIGFTGLHREGQLHTFVIPFFNPQKENGCHYDTESDEIAAWQAVARINQNTAVKIFQNGSYDNSYLVKYHVPTTNFYFDTYHAFHSLWCEAEKKLNFIASICLDYCRYWKDETKGAKEDSFGKTQEQLERYWRYNALDCYNTFLSARVLLATFLTSGMEWAKKNYLAEFALQFGPAFAGAMRGMKVDRNRQQILLNNLEAKAEKTMVDLKIMADDPEFNPNSADQVATLLYDVLGMEPTKKKGKKGKDLARSVDEKLLKLLVLQHPIYEHVVDQIWKVKKPLNNVSKYGDGFTYKGRFLYSLNAGATETSRFASKSHYYWCGTNAQNVPQLIRGMMVADPGYVFLECDYSQSDGWFIAHEAEELNMINTYTSGKDTHCVHAAHFFKKPYELILQKYKDGDPFYAHDVTGVRALTKRIVHGSNFRMEAYTLFMTMGIKAVRAAAEALNYRVPIFNQKTGQVTGYRTAGQMTENDMIDFCDKMLLSEYHIMYPRLKNNVKNWFNEIVENAIANRNKASTAFGFTRLFFGDIRTDKAIQRELSAFYGQGGTAGNINRTLLEYYYGSGLDGNGCLFHTQTHDSILLSLDENRLELAENILTIMRKPVTIKGRTFVVPVDAKVGRSWGKGMTKYKTGIKLAEIDAAEKQFAATFEKLAKEMDVDSEELESFAEAA